MGHSLLDLGDGLAGIEVLRTDLGAVHDGVAPVELEGVVEVVQAFLGGGVAGILDPPVGLHEDGRSEVLVGVPPVARTGRRAARAQDAFVHSVELGAVVFRLEELALELGVAVGTGIGAGAFVAVDVADRRLEPRFDRSVLLVKISHVGDQILQNVHVGQGVNLRRRFAIVVDVGQTRERVGSLNVHRAATANPFPARPSKGQRGILLVLDLEQGVQYHRTAIVEIDGIRAQVGFLVFLLGIPSVDLEVLDPLLVGIDIVRGHLRLESGLVRRE